MIFKPISDYYVRRNGKGLKIEGVREPNGRRSRKASLGSEEVVYLVVHEGTGRVKAGRTRNAKQRMLAYESNSGVAVRWAIRLVVATKDDGKTLERHIIAALAAKFQRFKREWFWAEEHEALVVALESLADSPVPIVSQSGCGPDNKPDYDLHKAHSSPRSMVVRV